MSDLRTAARDFVALAAGELTTKFKPNADPEYGMATVTVPGRVWVALVSAVYADQQEPPAAPPSAGDREPRTPMPVAPVTAATVEVAA